MEPILKIALFFIFFFSIAIGGYKAYKYCNEKITGSSNGWKVLSFSLLLIVINLFLFFGGLYTLISVYTFLSE